MLPHIYLRCSREIIILPFPSLYCRKYLSSVNYVLIYHKTYWNKKTITSALTFCNNSFSCLMNPNWSSIGCFREKNTTLHLNIPLIADETKYFFNKIYLSMLDYEPKSVFNQTSDYKTMIPLGFLWCHISHFQFIASDKKWTKIHIR